MENIALIHAGGPAYSGKLNTETRERCKTALKLLRAKKIDTLYIAVESLRESESMKNFFVENGVTSDHIVCNPHGTDTIGEITAVLQQKGMAPETEISAISSWYHIPRIWLIFSVNHRKVKLYAAWKGARLKSIVYELAKILRFVFKKVTNGSYATIL